MSELPEAVRAITAEADRRLSAAQSPGEISDRELAGTVIAWAKANDPDILASVTPTEVEGIIARHRAQRRAGKKARRR